VDTKKDEVVLTPIEKKPTYQELESELSSLKVQAELAGIIKIPQIKKNE
jgi:hypothetical protein